MKITALIPVLLASPLQAGSPQENTAPLARSILSGQVGITFANQYNARGIIVQDDGLTLQPYLNLNAKLQEGSGLIRSTTLTLGLWADISTNDDLAAPGNSYRNFTEFDYGIGLSFDLADRFKLSTFYNRWTSPADAYGDGHWINATIAYDDSGLHHENFSIKPSLMILRDLGGDASAGLRNNAWYLEPGIRPNYTIRKESPSSLNLAFPVKAGFGNEFYAGETFGYLAFGPCVGTSLGKWNFEIGYLHYVLGNTLQAIKGRSHEHLYSFHISRPF